MENKEKHVSETKKKLLEELTDLARKHNTIMVLAIENIPSADFQKIKKELRGTAKIKVVKRRVIEKTIEQISSDKKNIEKLKDKMLGNFALLFSNKDAFEIAAILNKSKIPARAKPDQIAPQDIILEAGPTELVAGPALSELTKLGIKASVEGGKIAIRERKILVKKGEKIKEEIASALTILEITPFSLNIVPAAAYDSNTFKVYLDINVNPEQTIHDLKQISMQSITLAQKINYICKETITILISKASQEANMLSKNLKN